MSDPSPFKVAAVQASPVFLDREATLARACDLIAEAGAAGARLAVFPEAFIPGYPFWIWYLPAGQTHPLRALYAELLANAVDVPGPVTAALGEAARAANVAVAIGVNERNAEASGTSLYNSLLSFGPDGRLLGRHRKLVPTAGERLVHAQGDARALAVYPLPIGRLGGLICWENYMPLARYALYAQGVQLYAAPTWDRGEPWISTLRHIAKEGRAVVVGCCSAMRKDDVPDRLGLRELLAFPGDWLNPGDSAIVDPDGKFLAGPAHEEQTILYAEVDPRRHLAGPRWQLDVGGHYSRPDLFRLTVDRGARPLLEFTGGGAAEGERTDLEDAGV
jgi:nitrilase